MIYDHQRFPSSEERHVFNSQEIRTRFDIDQILGKGAFATVYRAKYKTGVRGRRRRNIYSLNDHHDVYCQDARARQKENDHPFVSLKFVNVSQVSKKRREQEDARGIMKGTSAWVRENSNTKNDDDLLPPDLSMSEYDTEQLFFPSRIDQKNATYSHDKNGLQDYMASNKSDAFIQSRKLLQREIEVHLNVSKSNHPNIVSMLESFEYSVTVSTKKERNLIMTMVIEYCPLGDLHQYMKRKRNERNEEMNCNMNQQQRQQQLTKTFIDEKEIQRAMRQILRGLAFLHSRGVVHRDIKAANIFLTKSTSSGKWMNDKENEKDSSVNITCDPFNFTLDDCCLKIGDFGLAVQMSDDDDWDDAQHTLCGTPSCLAPEVALSSPTPNKGRKRNEMFQSDQDSLLANVQKGGEDNIDLRGHGQPADLWSVGCILYVMLFGRYPFSTCKKTMPNALDNAKNISHLPTKLMKIRDTIQNVVKGNWSIPQNFDVQDTSIKLLSQLLSHDPKCRGFARGILSSHVFFSDTKLLPMPIKQYSENNMTTSVKPKETSVLRCLGDKTNSSTFQQNISYQKWKNESDHQILGISLTSKVDMTLLQDQVKASQRSLNQTSNSKKAQFKYLCTPMKDLHKLPVMKHQWEVEKHSQTSSERKKIHFTIFVLPEHKGIVFQCEKIGGSGIWMHLLEDGKHISMGKLSKHSRFQFNVNVHEGRTNNDMINEAFSRQPMKCRYCNSMCTYTSTNLKRYINIANENQSMCTIGQVDTTAVSSQSMNSMPFSIRTKRRNHKFKQLSSLLHDKNKSYLAVYRTMEKFVRKLRRKLPKVHLSIYNTEVIHQLDKANNQLLCVVTIMDSLNDDIIIVHFIDGTRILYNRSNGDTKFEMPSKDGKNQDVLNLNMNSNDSLSQLVEKLRDKEDKAIISYFQFARSAIRKVIEIELKIDIKGSKSAIPQIGLTAVTGKSYKSWINITDESIGAKSRKLFSGHLLNRCLNYDQENDLSHPLESQFRI